MREVRCPPCTLRVRRERERLRTDIQSAAAARGTGRLALLEQAKQWLDRQLRELLRPEKNLTYKRTE